MYNNLNAEFTRHGITKKTVSQLIGCTPGTLRYKMIRERSDFTVEEFQLIYDTYFKEEKIDILYLMEFSKK